MAAKISVVIERIAPTLFDANDLADLPLVHRSMLVDLELEAMLHDSPQHSRRLPNAQNQNDW
jgi:hypothetical protein